MALSDEDRAELSLLVKRAVRDGVAEALRSGAAGNPSRDQGEKTWRDDSTTTRESAGRTGANHDSDGTRKFSSRKAITEDVDRVIDGLARTKRRRRTG